MAFWHIFLGVQMKKLLITLIFLMLVGTIPTIAQEEIDPLGDPVVSDSSGTEHTYHSYDWLGDPEGIPLWRPCHPLLKGGSGKKMIGLNSQIAKAFNFRR